MIQIINHDQNYHDSHSVNQVFSPNPGKKENEERVDRVMSLVVFEKEIGVSDVTKLDR